MCIQCGCSDPRYAADNAAAWAETGARQREGRLEARIERLEQRARKLDLMPDEVWEHLRNIVIWAALWDRERNNDKNGAIYDLVLPYFRDGVSPEAYDDQPEHFEP